MVTSVAGGVTVADMLAFADDPVFAPVICCCANPLSGGVGDGVLGVTVVTVGVTTVVSAAGAVRSGVSLIDAAAMIGAG